MPSIDLQPQLTVEQTKSRLKEISKLRDGWLNGHGKALQVTELNWLATRIATHFVEDSSQPFIYPTPEGNIRLEWSAEPTEASLEIDLTTHLGEWHALQLQTDVEEIERLDLNHDNAWMILSDKVRTLAGGKA